MQRGGHTISQGQADDDLSGAIDAPKATRDRVDILLATFNGARFLDEQLKSIEAQTHSAWRLIVRDDGSTDATPAIIETFRRRNPKKVVVLHDSDGNLGLVQNFSRLMEHASAEYIAFCDQDDVWLPEKLELSLAKMRELEDKYGCAMPLLVFTDLTVVDEDLQVIDPSFWHYQRIRPERCKAFNRLLLQNVVTGCTTLFTRQLRDQFCPIPNEANYHDWWAALAGAAFGHLDYVKAPTVYYRQHSQNVTGASEFRSEILRALSVVRIWNLQKDIMRGYFIQANSFRQRYGELLETEDRDAIEGFIAFRNANFVKRIQLALRYRILPVGFLFSFYVLVVRFK